MRRLYLVDDSENRQPKFQRSIITAVERVTHIAPPDAKGDHRIALRCQGRDRITAEKARALRLDHRRERR
jgi:hypothetical protein